MLFNFCIQTKHFSTKKYKFFKKMNYFIKILYPNTLSEFLHCFYDFKSVVIINITKLFVNGNSNYIQGFWNLYLFNKVEISRVFGKWIYN